MHENKIFNMMKTRILFLLGIMLFALSLSAQVPYTPFPKDSLSWHLWGGSFEIMEHPFSFGINGYETIIDGKNYTQVWGLDIDIREEDKRVYAYIPEYGEHLLYDFNIEIGDTIFYHIGMFIHWGMHSFGGFQPAEHYAVVSEKGTITLKNGSVRNTITLQTFGSWVFDSIQWIEGLGATNMIGLLDPFVYTHALDGTGLSLVCVCEENNAAGCLLYNYCGNHPGILAIGCPCSPLNSILENEKDEITIHPNPTTGKLLIESEELHIEKIEIFDIFGRKQNVEVENFWFAEIKIDISHLPAGVYFVKITTQTTTQTKKIIKL